MLLLNTTQQLTLQVPPAEVLPSAPGNGNAANGAWSPADSTSSRGLSPAAPSLHSPAAAAGGSLGGQDERGGAICRGLEAAAENVEQVWAEPECQQILC